MIVEAYEQADRFLDDLAPLLGGDVARHSMVLGVAGQAARGAGDGVLMLAVRGPRGDLQGCAIALPGQALHLGGCTEQSALALGRFCSSPKWNGAPELACGETAAVRAFASAFDEANLERGLRLHALTGVANDLAPAAGAMALPRGRDRGLLQLWTRGYIAETGLDVDLDEALELRSVAEGRVRLWLVEGNPVAMAAFTRESTETLTIASVYTPPELRGHGAATALVAAMCREALGSGKTRLLLFTDVANPTSNAVYARIGFAPVADHESWQLG